MVKVSFPWIPLWAAPLVNLDLVIPRNRSSLWQCGCLRKQRLQTVVPAWWTWGFPSLFIQIPIQGWKTPATWSCSHSASGVARPSDAMKTLMLMGNPCWSSASADHTSCPSSQSSRSALQSSEPKDAALWTSDTIPQMAKSRRSDAAATRTRASQSPPGVLGKSAEPFLQDTGCHQSPAGFNTGRRNMDPNALSQ